MRILGIDRLWNCRLRNIDYVNGQYNVVDYGVIETSKEESVQTCYCARCRVFNKKPDEMAVEQLIFFKILQL